MLFEGKEIAALLKMGFSMAAADGKFSDEEKIAVTIVMDEFGLSEDEMMTCVMASRSMEASEAIATLSALSEDQKKYAAGFLAIIMTADSDTDEVEEKMWQLICSFASFPVMTVPEAVDFWKNN